MQLEVITCICEMTSATPGCTIHANETAHQRAVEYGISRLRNLDVVSLGTQKEYTSSGSSRYSCVPHLVSSYKML